MLLFTLHVAAPNLGFQSMISSGWKPWTAGCWTSNSLGYQSWLLGRRSISCSPSPVILCVVSRCLLLHLLNWRNKTNAFKPAHFCNQTQNKPWCFPSAPFQINIIETLVPFSPPLKIIIHLRKSSPPPSSLLSYWHRRLKRCGVPFFPPASLTTFTHTQLPFTTPPRVVRLWMPQNSLFHRRRNQGYAALLLNIMY